MTPVFVHGAGFTGACFERQRTAFPESQAPDLPGHCREGRASTIDEFARFVADYVKAQEIDDAVLCGHSLGGAIALHAVLEKMIAPKALLLIASGARLRVAAQTLEALRFDFPAASRELAKSFFANPTPARVQWAAATMLTVGSVQTVLDFEACNSFDVLDRLSEITVPMLALTGARDVMTPPKYAQTLADRVPKGETRIIPGAGHFVMIEQPEETNEAIRSFLSGIV